MGLLVPLLIVGIVVLAVVCVSSFFGPTEHDFVESASSSGECLRLDDTTAVVQLQVASADEHALEVDHAELIDSGELTITALGLVDVSRAPITTNTAPSLGTVEALTVPNERFLDLRAASPESAFLLLVVHSESGEARRQA